MLWLYIYCIVLGDFNRTLNHRSIKSYRLQFSHCELQYTKGTWTIKEHTTQKRPPRHTISFVSNRACACARAFIHSTQNSGAYTHKIVHSLTDILTVHTAMDSIIFVDGGYIFECSIISTKAIPGYKINFDIR